MTTRRDRERMIAEGTTTVDAELAAVENKLAQAIRERDKARREVSEEEREYLNETIRNLNNQLVDALRERDEARQMYCKMTSRDNVESARYIADRHGWDCFKEDGK